MKTYKVKTKVAQNFNDSKNNFKLCEVGEELILERDRYEELLSKGKVEKGTIIDNEPIIKEAKKTFKKEEE